MIYRLAKSNSKDLFAQKTKSNDEMFGFAQPYISRTIWERYMQSGENFERLQKFLKNDVKDEQIILAVSKDEFFAKKEEIKRYIEKLLDKGQSVKLVIDGDDIPKDFADRRVEYTYSKEEITEICQVNQELREKGMSEDIRFSEFFKIEEDKEFDECWTLDKVLKANSEIKSVVQFIKDHNFSPYEAMIYIHKYVISHFTYCDIEDENKGYRSMEDTRNIVYAYEFDMICCVGYSSLVKAIIDELGDPNLRCQCVSVGIKNKGYDFMDSVHSYNTVEINDEKYDIKGVYREDACFDCCYGDKSFAYCLQPIRMYDYLKDNVIHRQSMLGYTRRMAVRDYQRDWEEDNGEYWTQRDAENYPIIPVQKLLSCLNVVLKAENPQIKKEEEDAFLVQTITASFGESANLFNEDAPNSFICFAKENGLNHDKNFLLNCIAYSADAFLGIEDELKNDEEFMFEAVKANIASLQYLSGKLIKNKAFVEKLRGLDILNDEKTVVRLIKKSPDFIYFSSLSKDEDFLLKAIALDWFVIEFVDGDFENNPDFMLKAIRINSDVLIYSNLRKNVEFMIKAIKICPNILNNKNIKFDKKVLKRALEMIMKERSQNAKEKTDDEND